MYSHTPLAILAYTCPKLEESFHIYGKEHIRHAIDSLFEVTCQTVGLAPDDLLSLLSFEPNNKDWDMIQSMFGVMRAINTLSNLQFTNITPLPSNKISKEADLLAKRGACLYAIEVFRANERTWRYPGLKCEEYISARYLKQKKAQLDATMVTHRCQKAIVAIVFDSDSKALLGESDFQEVVEIAHMQSGSPPNTHFLLFTGHPSTSYSGDEVIVWPQFST